MRIEFTKMQGAGNDYVYVDCLKYGAPPFDPTALARAVSPRRRSRGADGLVLICPTDEADAFMRMFNADGSEGRMCGNAIRCVARYLYDRGICPRRDMTILTLSGVKRTTVLPDGGVTVDMGKAEFGDRLRAALRGRAWEVTRVSTGNPHAVCFTERIDRLDLETLGPAFENAPVFGGRVNAEFAEIIGTDELKMRVWERGSGETEACGTGACAVTAAAVKAGLLPPDTEITVHLKGGDLRVLCRPDYRLFLTGDATKVYDGVYEYAEDKT